MRVGAGLQPADHRGGVGLLGLVPGLVQEPQDPEPAQQVVRVAADGQWAVVVEGQVGEVPSDRLDEFTVAADHGVRQVLAWKFDDRADPGHVSRTFDELVPDACIQGSLR